MFKLPSTLTLRVVALPIVGAVGAVVAMMWPAGHQAFCSGLKVMGLA